MASHDQRGASGGDDLVRGDQRWLARCEGSIVHEADEENQKEEEPRDSSRNRVEPVNWLQTQTHTQTEAFNSKRKHLPIKAIQTQTDSQRH